MLSTFHAVLRQLVFATIRICLVAIGPEMDNARMPLLLRTWLQFVHIHVEPVLTFVVIKVNRVHIGHKRVTVRRMQILC